MGEGQTPTTSSVQTDLFCNCGYNLYAQIVHVDDRLGIPVCRCPECGRHHAMNTTQPVQSPWTARVGLLLMSGYVLLLLYGVVMTTIGIGLMQYGVVSAAEEASRAMTMQWDRQSSPAEQFWWQWLAEIVFVLAALCGFIYMMLAVSFFWHWRRDAYWNLLAVPLLTAGVTCWIGIENHDRAFLADAVGWRLAGAVISVMLGMGLGVLWARKAVRGLLAVLLPPRARQALSFLWLVDGKPVPGQTFAARQPPPSPVE